MSIKTKYKGLKSAREVLEKRVGPFNFAMFVRAARTGLDLTQVQMAEKLGISRAMLCDIEKGRQSVSVLMAKKIANVAGLHEKHAVRTCLQDQLDKAKIKYTVVLEA